MFQIVFLTHMGRNLEILFKRIYWQVLLQKAIDNRTMMIGHPAFSDWFHRLDQDGQELALDREILRDTTFERNGARPHFDFAGDRFYQSPNFRVGK